MPNGDKVVSVPGIGTIQFPGSMPDAAVNMAIQDYMMRSGAGITQQAARQGIDETKKVLPSPEPSISTATMSARPSGAMTWLENAMTDVKHGSGSTWLGAALQKLGAQGTETGTSPAIAQMMGGPVTGPLEVAHGVGRTAQGHPVQGLNEVARGAIGTGGPGSYALGALNPVIMAEAIAGQKLASYGAGKLGADQDWQEMAGNIGGLLGTGGEKGVKGTVGELLDEGFTKESMLADRAAHAKNVQAHFSDVATMAHQRAQAAMQTVSSAIDQAHPEGVFDRAALKDEIGDAYHEIVKTTPDRMPSSLSSLMKETKTKATETPIIGGKALDLKNPVDMKAYQNLKAGGAFSPDEIKAFEGEETAKPKVSFEELKQIRSDLAQTGLRKAGTSGAAANRIYGVLSDKLRGAAASQGLDSDWINANAQWKNYVDDFIRSPIRKAMNAKTPEDVMTQLRGKGGEQVKNIMAKYEDLNSSPEAVKAEVKRASVQDMMNRLSRPRAYDILFGPLAATRQAVRFARTPGVLDWLSGQGLPDIPASKIQAGKP